MKKKKLYTTCKTDANFLVCVYFVLLISVMMTNNDIYLILYYNIYLYIVTVLCTILTIPIFLFYLVTLLLQKNFFFLKKMGLFKHKRIFYVPIEYYRHLQVPAPYLYYYYITIQALYYTI